MGEIFVTFFDHGAVGLIAFPGLFGPTMHKKQLQQALQTMHDKKMYKKLVFYLESCESGSMFQDMNIPGIYALSAAGPDESSWGTYCGSEAKVNGKSIGSCLGDLYSINWMEDCDKVGKDESLQTQFTTVKKLTSKSHVMQYGDLSWTSDPIGDFMGDTSNNASLTSTSPRKPSVNVKSRDIPLHLA